MISTCIIGASGYTGAELIKIIIQHPHFSLDACYVSNGSEDSNKAIGAIHPQLLGQTSLVTIALAPNELSQLADTYDAIFLATPHEASHDWASALSGKKAKIFDLSGAFRLQDAKVFEAYYGFKHEQTSILKNAVYGLAEWHSEAIKSASFVAVPGCYPTASLLALKPMSEAGFIDPQVRPVINATSGVSGAGRKPSMTTSFFEVSLQAYGVLGHRHTPEIEDYSGAKVIFTPHLGQFKRGILATITMKLLPNISTEDIRERFEHHYAEQALVRLRDTWPKIDDVANTPFCDIHWKFDEDSAYLVVSSAIDNLLKGAASQAVQCANLAFKLPSETGLIKQ
ncbi:N-acetyl-gamma-glutamyl-phosphate reductase [Glaciecola sp. MF2-115]|uniref:N-acetyl-gamma-glutamyl-phosphate reductase n=1 Tax=Glaciecola sp. MF2-115 TaxID=3384827 RepID=UPI00399F323A